MTAHQHDGGRRARQSRAEIARAEEELSVVQKILVGSVWDKVQELVEENKRLREYIEDRFAAQDRLNTAQDRLNKEQEARMNVLSKAKTQERGLPSASYLSHQDIRAKLNTLADQVLLNIAVSAAGNGEPRQEAEIIGHIARLLFPERGPSPSPDADTLARQLKESGVPITADQLNRARELAAEIRSAAEATGHTIDWDFALDPGAPLDPERQQPHGGRDADGTADFVTMPGYAADGKVYVKQRVFMVPKPMEPPQHEPAGALPPEQPATTESAVLKVGLVIPLPPDLDKRRLKSLQALADAIQLERPGRAVRLSEIPGTEERQILVEDDGRTLCTVVPVSDTEKVEVTIHGEVDEVIACARWFRMEAPVQGLDVYLQRREPLPWVKAWSESPCEPQDFTDFLLGDEPRQQQ